MTVIEDVGCWRYTYMNTSEGDVRCELVEFVVMSPMTGEPAF